MRLSDMSVSSRESRIARRYGVLLANGTTVALACEDRIRENP
jgi:hypothetical protein